LGFTADFKKEYYNWLCNAKCSRSEKCHSTAVNSLLFAFGDGPNEANMNSPSGCLPEINKIGQELSAMDMPN
jgi:hypothetical protein